MFSLKHFYPIGFSYWLLKRTPTSRLINFFVYSGKRYRTNRKNHQKLLNFFTYKYGEFFVFFKQLFFASFAIRTVIQLKFFFKKCRKIFTQAMDDGLIYLRGLFIVFFIDACITDDEPLWEPLEWSLVQTWIFFIFIFAWIAENLISSRYGAYTGRDKRVWFAWYKTFWLIELWYLISFGAATLFVIVPFYYELTYNISFVFSWWNWYSRVFFFKFIGIYSIILLLSTILLINLRWLNWKKIFIIVLIINCFLSYLLYVHFIMSFFGYFTDPIWYQKTRFIDFVQLSHEPLKWGWGPAKRDHFTYHKVSTVFWFKNDSPFAASFLMIHLFLFLTTFFLNFYWLVLLRRVYTTQEATFTYLTYCVSSLKQYFYYYLLLYVFVFISFLTTYWRFPIELIWLTNCYSWWEVFASVVREYPNLINSLLV